MMHLLDFLLHRRQKRSRRLSDTTDTTVRTAASRLEFPIIPKRRRKDTLDMSNDLNNCQ